jgi:hypothetical protein
MKIPTFKVTFRSWVNQLWLEHKKEVLEVTGKPVNYEAKEYFTKYKWWLRREYKFQREKL